MRHGRTARQLKQLAMAWAWAWQASLWRMLCSGQIGTRTAVSETLSQSNLLCLTRGARRDTEGLCRGRRALLQAAGRRGELGPEGKKHTGKDW